MTVTEEVEVRYRTETRTDSEGNEYDVEVAYNYYILNVDLENFNLSHVPVYIMGEEQLSMYAMYMSSLGNRPDLFRNPAIFQNTMKTRQRIMKSRPPIWKMNSLRGSLRKRKSMSVFLMCGAAAARKPLLIAAVLLAMC